MTKLSHDILVLPKVELHVHVEGTMTPAKCRELAQKNNVTLVEGLFTGDGEAYHYDSFLDLVTRVYFGMADAIKTKEDYEDITYDYLKRCAAENAIYIELIACPSQCARSNIPYQDMIDGIAAGIDRARFDFGIESLINVTLERAPLLSCEEVSAQAQRDADLILSYPHPYIVGLDIAGGEKPDDIPPFRSAFERIKRSFPRPLGLRMHAAENAGPANALDAINFDVTRIGHGVQSILSADVMTQLKSKNIMLEVCPTSNVLALKNFSPTYESHPLRVLYDAGLHLSLNSDDPGLFGHSLGQEYQIAHEKFNFTLEELLGISADAVNFSFAPETMKEDLRKKIGV